MNTRLFISALTICLLAFTNVQAQFFFPKKCIFPDSIFTELQPGSLNIWASGGFRKGREDGKGQHNWFSAVTVNYVAMKYLETGLRVAKPIPQHEPYSYQHSFDYVPYVRYSVLANACYKLAFWGELSYHIERKRTKEATVSRLNAPAAGFGLYKTIGRFLWAEVHSEYLPTEKIARQEFTLVWKMLHADLSRKKKTHRVNLNVPLPIF